MNEPTTLAQGDAVSWTEHFDDYPASLFILKYIISGLAASNLTITATADGDDFDVEITSAQSALLDPPGTYAYSGKLYDINGNRYPASSGMIAITADPENVVGIDQRSHYQKVIDTITAVIEGRASQAEEEFTIAGRSLRRTPMKDLIAIKQQYERLLESEIQQQQQANGTPNDSNMVAFQFANPAGRRLQ